MLAEGSRIGLAASLDRLSKIAPVIFGKRAGLLSIEAEEGYLLGASRGEWL